MTKASLVINFSVPIYLLLLFASATEDNIVLDLQTAFWVYSFDSSTPHTVSDQKISQLASKGIFWRHFQEQMGESPFRKINDNVVVQMKFKLKLGHHSLILYFRLPALIIHAWSIMNMKKLLSLSFVIFLIMNN